MRLPDNFANELESSLLNSICIAVTVETCGIARSAGHAVYRVFEVREFSVRAFDEDSKFMDSYEFKIKLT